MSDKWVVIDTETGGLNPNRHPIFALGLVVLDTRTGPLCGLEVPVRDLAPPDPQAVAITGIDLEAHLATAMPPDEAVRTLETFLAPHFDLRRPVTIAGHNVAFDIAFLKRLYRLARLAGAQPAIKLNYHTVDLHSAWAVLAAAGIAPTSQYASLDAIAHALGVIPEQPRHSALADALTTAYCFHALIGLASRRSFVYKAMQDWATMAASPSKPAPERLLWAGRAEGAAAALQTLFGPSTETEAACTAARRVVMGNAR